MIRLKVDLIYLCNKYNVSARELVEMSEGKSISDIMQLEAQNGNTKAADFQKNVLQDPSALIEAFRLADPANRYAILSNLNPTDLQYFMKYLNSQELSLGLKFFTKDKILSLLQKLPPEKLFQVLQKIFSVQDIIKLIPEKELNKFLQPDNVDKKVIMQYLTELPPQTLQKMIQNVTGTPCKDQSQEAMLQTINSFSDKTFQDSITSLDVTSKTQIITGLLRDDPSYIKKFSSAALTAPFQILQKPDIIQAVGEALPPKDVMKLIAGLPKELMSIVATQIDPKDFASLLTQNFQDVLAQVTLR